MNIQLKNIKHSEFASHETECFQATIYIDGKKVGTVENDGQGGCDSVHPHAVAERINEWAKTLPPKVCNFIDPETNEACVMPQDCEIIINDLLNQYLTQRSLKRQCAKKVLFRKPSETYGEGEYNTIARPYTKEVKEYLVQKYGSAVEILNEQIA